MKTQDQKTVRTVNRQITAAQSELLDFCRHVEAPELLESFKLVLESAVFDQCIENKQGMYMTYRLCETLKLIAAEGTPDLSRNSA